MSNQIDLDTELNDIDFTDIPDEIDFDGDDFVNEDAPAKGSLFNPKVKSDSKIKISIGSKKEKAPEASNDGLNEVFFDNYSSFLGLENFSELGLDIDEDIEKEGSLFNPSPNAITPVMSVAYENTSMTLNDAFETKFGNLPSDENSNDDFEKDLLKQLNENNEDEPQRKDNSSPSEKGETLEYLSTAIQILQNSNNAIYSSDSDNGLRNTSFMNLKKFLDSSDSNIHKEIIQKEIDYRITALSKSLSESVFNASKTEKQHIQVTAETLKGRHSVKLGKKLFKPIWGTNKIKSIGFALQETITTMIKFGKWARANSSDRLKNFFTPKSKGYAVGNDNMPRPTNYMAHFLGAAAVTSTYFALLGGFSLETKFSEENKNAENNLRKIAVDFSETSLDAFNDKTNKPLETVSINVDEYPYGESQNDIQVPSSQFITKAYEQMHTANPKLSMADWLPAIADFNSLLQVCYKNEQNFCTMTISPNAEQNTSFGKDEKKLNSIVLDATNGIFEIYDDKGQVTFSETLDIDNKNSLSWF